MSFSHLVCHICVDLTPTSDKKSLVADQWLASFASNQRLSPLSGSSTTSGNAENLSQYDPGFKWDVKPQFWLLTHM